MAETRVKALFGGRVPERPTVSVPPHEMEAQRAFSTARRALVTLRTVAAKKPGVCGPCTDYLAEIAPQLAAMMAGDPWKKGYRWRAHSGIRNTPAALAVSAFGGMRLDGKPYYTDTDLAYVALAWGAPIPKQTKTVGECVRDIAEAIRADRNRRDSRGKDGKGVRTRRRAG